MFCVLEVDLGPVSEAVVRIQMHPGVPEIPTEICKASKWAMPPHFIGPILLGPRDSRTRIPTYHLTNPLHSIISHHSPPTHPPGYPATRPPNQPSRTTSTTITLYIPTTIPSHHPTARPPDKHHDTTLAPFHRIGEKNLRGGRPHGHGPENRGRGGQASIRAFHMCSNIRVLLKRYIGEEI